MYKPKPGSEQVRIGAILKSGKVVNGQLSTLDQQALSELYESGNPHIEKVAVQERPPKKDADA